MFSFLLRVFPLYIMLPCFMHSVQYRMPSFTNERISILSMRPTPPQTSEHEASHHGCMPATTYTASQHVLYYFFPPFSPPLFLLVIVLFVDDDRVGTGKLTLHKDSPAKHHAVPSVVSGCIIRAAMCESPVHPLIWLAMIGRWG